MAGGGGSSSQTTTQTQSSGLPAWLSQANKYGANQAKSIYQQGMPAYYPGSTVAPLSPIQEQYFSGVSGLGASGNPALNAAQDYATNAASGAYLNSNPYLDSMFNQAAGAVQNRIMSQFAGSGRNPEASIPVQADQLNQLATQIYGGNYANERQLQAQAAGMAPGIDTTQLANLGMLGSAGGQLQNQTQAYINDAMNRWNYQQNAPRSNLDWYMNAVNSLAHGTNSSTTTTQPLHQNQSSNILGGALAGSQIGSSIGSGYGGWGALAGGLLGAFS